MRASAKKLASSLVLASAAAIFVVAFTTEARAQAKPTPNSLPGAETNREMRDREANITLLERGKDEAKSREAAQKQMNEDFQQIQTENAAMMTVFRSGNPDYKKISSEAADIKVRALRLKNFLVLPPTAKDEKRKKEKEPDSSDMKATIPALTDSIKSFVGNPIFQQQAGQQVDYRDVAKARRDLDDVIEFSSKIAKTAEKVNK